MPLMLEIIRLQAVRAGGFPVSVQISPPRGHAPHDPAAGVAITPERVHDVLARHVLVDGFKLVYDTQASQGSWLARVS